VTPEAADYLFKAHEYLDKARSLLEVMHSSDEAARAAYLAGFHAAQALVFERTTRIAKSHSGLRTTKEIADYGIGPQAVVTAAEAQEMIDLATRFVDRMGEIPA
jgi:uncharacterized protein (UPF0332 family)